MSNDPNFAEKLAQVEAMVSGAVPTPSDLESLPSTDAAPDELPTFDQIMAEAEKLAAQPEQPVPNEYSPPVSEPSPTVSPQSPPVSEPPATAAPTYSLEQVQQIVAQQLAYAQQQFQQPAPAPDPRQLRRQQEEAMVELGMSPEDPVHRVAYQYGLEVEGLKQQFGSELQNIRQELNYWKDRARQISTEEAVGTKVSQALAQYGQLPTETTEAIRSRVSAAVLAGVPEEQAIRDEMKGYVALLSRITKAPAPTQQVQAPTAQAPAPQNDLARQMAAVAVSGRGGGRHLPKVNLSQIEKMLFR
jgi:hypothetical protein